MRLELPPITTALAIIGKFATLNAAAIVAVVTDNTILAVGTLIGTVFMGVTGLYKIYSDNRKDENARALIVANIRIMALEKQNTEQAAEMLKEKRRVDLINYKQVEAAIVADETKKSVDASAAAISRIEGSSGEIAVKLREEPQD